MQPMTANTVPVQPRSVPVAQPPALLTKTLIRRHYLPIAERTLDRWIAEEKFPPPDIAMGGKVRYWRRETVEDWITQKAADTAANVLD
jgi:predicted DNA-binding transcriptional regulator AlpA